VTLTSTDVVTQSVEVAVIPLQDASNAAAIATFVGGVQTLTIPLANEDNLAVFSLVPSNAPGLTNEINYRIMWRIGGVTGRTETYDFAMPDADISFDEIQSIGNVITGQAYLQQTDLGVAGRVAKLNDQGQVVDAFGLPVASGTDLTTVQARITTEITNRLIQDQQRQAAIQAEFQNQIGYVSSSAAASLNSAVTGLNSAISSEASARSSANTTLTTNLATLQSTVTNNAQSTASSISTINTTLNNKADLDSGGKVPIGQIPAAAITSWITLTNAADRLNLAYPSQVQLGDVVLTPTGVYGLTGIDPSSASSWYLLNQVLSVNGYTGSIVLNPNDVGVTTGSSGSRVIASGITIPQAQVTSLVSDLALKAPLTTTASLQSQIDTIKNDTGYVKLSSGVINSSLLDSNVALINNLNQVVKKDGTVIGSGSGGSVFSVNGQTGVVTITTSTLGAVSTGALTTALASKADLVSSKVPVAQIPTGIPQDNIANLSTDLATKATLVNGKIPQATVEGLSVIISNNALTSTSNLAGRVYVLESSGGSGGGSSSGTASTKSVFWGGTGVADTVSVTDFSTVNLFSPFGITSGGVRYYRGGGVPASDVAFPVITTGGHLQLNKWNESNAPDPVYALASDLTTLSGSVTTLATTVSGKASSTDLTALSSTVTGLSNNKADKVSGYVPVAQIPTGIPQSNITNLVTDLAARATLTNGVLTSSQIPTAIPQASVTNLTTDLAAKAPLVSGKVPVTNIPLLIPQANIENLTSALAAKAPLVNSLVPVANIPTGIPQANITNLTTDLAARATLTNGVLTAAQIPTGIPQANIANLTSDLSARATLTNGVLTLAQLPFVATQHPKVFSTQGALTAMNELTFSQVSLGDQCIITANTTPSTTDIGTYTVVGTNSTTGAPVWQKHPSSAGAIISIASIKNDGSAFSGTPNTSGVLTLTASDIGAQPYGSYVTTSSLGTTLTNYVTTSGLATSLTSAVLNATQTNSVKDIVKTSAPIRGRVDYVCTLALTSLSNNPIIGVDALGANQTAQNNSRILLTNQAIRRDNGIWVVNTGGAWSRPTDDYNTGQTVLPNTIVIVNCRTTTFPAGSNNYTLWQCTNTASVVIGDGETTWGDANGSPVPYGYMSQPVKLTTATGNTGNGIVIGGTYPNVTLGQTVSSGGGLTQTSSGPAIDTSVVVRKYSTTVVTTSTNTSITVTHSLAIGSNVAPHVSVMESGGSGWAVLVGWRKNPTNPTNQIDLEFSPSAAGSYIVTVMG
jgi:hypothetical protein